MSVHDTTTTIVNEVLDQSGEREKEKRNVTYTKQFLMARQKKELTLHQPLRMCSLNYKK